MAYEFKIVRRVEFSETDMAGIMHYSNFFRFMETAEHAFYRSLGFSVTMPGTEPRLGWPRVHAHCDYFKPLRFEDEVEVQLLVKEKKSKAITYLFKFRKLNGPGEDAAGLPEVARGLLTIVCVSVRPDGSMGAVSIPAQINGLISPAPEALLV